MERIIQNIYRRDLSALDRSYIEASRQNQVYDRVSSLEEKLKQALEPEYHATLQEYADAFMEYLDVCGEDDYVDGYRLGVQMMLAAWPQQKEI